MFPVNKRHILQGYAFLFMLTIIALNPLAPHRGTIWTQPKIFFVALITVLHLFFVWKQRKRIVLTQYWCRQAIGWLTFLFLGTLSTLLSPLPTRSLLGHNITADGLSYWCLIAGFVLTNSLVLQWYPNLFQWQLRGILVGSTLVALSILPQLFDWQIDYTFHSWKLWTGTDHILMSGVFQNHQSIGLYSHRGYAAFTLAISSVIALVALKNSWIPQYIAFPLIGSSVPMLMLTEVRGAIVAMLVGWVWCWLRWFGSRRMIWVLVLLSFISLTVVSSATSTRRISNLEDYSFPSHITILKHFTSDRHGLWSKAWTGFEKRLWIGWGFSGYTMADAFQSCPSETVVITLDEYYFYCQTVDGQNLKVDSGATKAHNLVLDWLVSLGILGASTYLILLGFSILVVARFGTGLEAIAVTYVVYTLTWFDCGQISHLGWWILSVGAFEIGQVDRNLRGSTSSSCNWV
ncbi:MAG: O-antigen ligase family protein [Leptolyngbyaceae cyanobacterium RM1_406_9]|nr:O-antigen ligase family protein [Leptolyngbyaceae cyanobacterium RM1_406_9]